MFRFTHTRLLVMDFKGCFNFYHEVMGFPVLWGDADGDYADFEVGPINLALFKRDAMAEAVGTSHLPQAHVAQDDVCLIFAVEDVDAAADELRQKGVHFVAEPTDHAGWGIRAAHFRDPDGNLIEIYKELKP